MMGPGEEQDQYFMARAVIALDYGPALNPIRPVGDFPDLRSGKAGAILRVKVTSKFKRDAVKIFPWRRSLHALRTRAASILASESTGASQREIKPQPLEVILRGAACVK